jgi:hypothetical protein
MVDPRVELREAAMVVLKVSKLVVLMVLTMVRRWDAWMAES